MNSPTNMESMTLEAAAKLVATILLPTEHCVVASRTKANTEGDDYRHKIRTKVIRKQLTVIHQQHCGRDPYGESRTLGAESKNKVHTPGRAQRTRHQATQGTDRIHKTADSTTAAAPSVQANAQICKLPSKEVFHLCVVEAGSSFLARSRQLGTHSLFPSEVARAN